MHTDVKMKKNLWHIIITTIIKEICTAHHLPWAWCTSQTTSALSFKENVYAWYQYIKLPQKNIHHSHIDSVYWAFHFLNQVNFFSNIVLFWRSQGGWKSYKNDIFQFKCINGRLPVHVGYIRENHWDELTEQSLVYLCTMLAYTSVVLLFPSNYGNNIMSRKSTHNVYNMIAFCEWIIF